MFIFYAFQRDLIQNGYSDTLFKNISHTHSNERWWSCSNRVDTLDVIVLKELRVLSKNVRISSSMLYDCKTFVQQQLARIGLFVNAEGQVDSSSFLSDCRMICDRSGSAFKRLRSYVARWIGDSPHLFDCSPTTQRRAGEGSAGLYVGHVPVHLYNNELSGPGDQAGAPQVQSKSLQNAWIEAFSEYGICTDAMIKRQPKNASGLHTFSFLNFASFEDSINTHSWLPKNSLFELMIDGERVMLELGDNPQATRGKEECRLFRRAEPSYCVPASPRQEQLGGMNSCCRASPTKAPRNFISHAPATVSYEPFGFLCPLKDSGPTHLPCFSSAMQKSFSAGPVFTPHPTCPAPAEPMMPAGDEPTKFLHGGTMMQINMKNVANPSARLKAFEGRPPSATKSSTKKLLKFQFLQTLQ